MKRLTMTVDLPELSPAELAAIFWDMDAKKQALFFDELGTLVMCTPAPFTNAIGSMFGLDMQMCAAGQEATALGKDAMERIGQGGMRYLKPTLAEAEGLIAGRPAA